MSDLGNVLYIAVCFSAYKAEFIFRVVSPAILFQSHFSGRIKTQRTGYHIRIKSQRVHRCHREVNTTALDSEINHGITPVHHYL